MATASHALVVLARAPELGRVKTRLAAGLGDAAALDIYRRLAGQVISTVRASDRYSLTVAYTPASAAHLMRQWLGASTELRTQAGGDLGARMAHAIGEAMASGAERVVVIGTDCPDLDAAVIDAAFQQLASSDVVLGPATDGGYYLIGMSRLHPQLFTDIPWSAPDTLRVTLERARASGISVALLDERRDIDTADDWRAWLASGTGAAAIHGFGR